MNIILVKKNISDLPYEFVERKGKGHPDTLSDNLAEYLSIKYSQYTKEKFGAILHHNFDKVGLLGGASDVGFGYGKLTKPIRVLLNGRASTKFGETSIDVCNLLTEWATEFICRNLPIVEPQRELEFHYNLSNQSSPGKTEEEDNKNKSSRKYWFEPRDLNDIPELKRLFSNDTSMGVGFAPFTALENLVLEIERTLTGESFGNEHPWIGTDIKIMGFRQENSYKITLCIPQIGRHVVSLEQYIDNIERAKFVIFEIARNNNIQDFDLYINTRDSYEKKELYLTAIGSSIESGDEGLVGRGNRIQGFIAPTRLMSMEGAAGKNPVYHIGKIYYLAAQRISERIYEKFKIPNEVVLISQSGRDLVDPWVSLIHLPESCGESDSIKSFFEEEIRKIPELTSDVVMGKINIC